jgi:hypothetical protein
MEVTGSFFISPGRRRTNRSRHFRRIGFYLIESQTHFTADVYVPGRDGDYSFYLVSGLADRGLTAHQKTRLSRQHWGDGHSGGCGRNGMGELGGLPPVVRRCFAT